MRPFAAATALSVVASFAAFAQAPHPQLEQVHKVYVLAMGGGLDQYLANQLTTKGVLEVVTDPKLADAIFTESIGTDFEARLTELFPPPPPPAVAPPPETKKNDKNKSTEVAYNTSAALRTSSFSRGRGNLFLVDLKSRSVVWSTFSVPKQRTADEYARTSAKMTEALARDLGRKK
jgi:hypothetical protein